MTVENSEIFKQIGKKKYNFRQIGKYTLVSNGLLGQKTNIIVDDINEPKTIFGICDGKGDFVNSTRRKKNNIAKILSKILKKKINFI